MENPNKQLDQEFRKALSAISFPNEIIPQGFRSWLKSALRHESGMSLNCDLETLEALHKKKEFNVFEISFAVNSIQAKSPHALDVDSTEYIDIMRRMEVIGKKWHELADPIKTSIVRRIQTQQSIKNGVPMGERIAIGKA